jgi:ABC-type nitrate/sulfonate/bicarbonate transport system substrate-binding protein
LKDGADVQTPEDLAGKTVYGPTGSSMMEILSVWLDHLGIEGVKFKEVDSASREPLLLSGEIDVIVGFATSMPPLQKAAADQGDELVALQPANEGLDTYYSSGLAAKQSYVDEHQDLAQGFVDAAVRSYAYAFDHIDEAAQIATETYPELDEDLNVKELEILRDLVTDEGRADTIGAIDPEKVQITIDYAKDVLGIEVPPEDLYLTDFAPK